MISIDTLRRDHVSAYGYERQTTPRIDELTRDGTLFTNAVSTSNWTLPAHMSLMTGLPASTHRVEDDFDRLSESVEPLASVLDRAGYVTGGFTSHVYLDRKYGFSRGFDHYQTDAGARANEISNRAIKWLDAHGQQPFFLFLHYFDPHWGYDPPAEFAEKFGPAYQFYGTAPYLLPFLAPGKKLPDQVIPHVLRLYDGEIAHTDHQIGRVTDWLRSKGQLDETLIVVVSDHGEEFGEHGKFGHGTGLHGEVTRIPMVLRYPRAERLSGRREDLVSIADIPATILSLTGHAAPSQFLLWARDLSSGPGGDVMADTRVVVSESTRWGPRRMSIQQSGHKLATGGSYHPVIFGFRNGREDAKQLGTGRLERAFYDVAKDPEERVNLLGSASHAESIGDLEHRLSEFIRDHVRGLRLACTGSEASSEYAGTIRFGAPLVDEPLRLSADWSASVTEQTANVFQFALRAGSGPASILFPVADGPMEIAIELHRSGKPFFQGRFELPPPGGVRSLGESKGKEGCKVWIPIYDRSNRKESTELTEEELETLRALGYIQ